VQLTLKERIDRFYENLNPKVRHSITGWLSVITLLLSVVLACMWVLGVFPAWLGLVLSGFRPELVEQHPIATTIAMYCGAFYVFIGWALYVVGALLIPVAWIFQLAARKWPIMHWPSRLTNLFALFLVCLPMIALAIELLCMLWIEVNAG
jgi:hypothetical protein